MCQDAMRKLTFETLLTDPMIRLMMAADGVTPEALVQPLLIAREAVVARECKVFSAVRSAPCATSGPA
jgi:hypothetical protein